MFSDDVENIYIWIMDNLMISRIFFQITRARILSIEGNSLETQYGDPVASDNISE